MINSSVAAKPVQNSFNDYVLKVLHTYPIDGTYPYSWTSEPNYVGITKDLFYKGEQFVIGDPEHRSYCSGMTFEVFFQAYQLYNEEHGFDQIGQLTTAQEMETLRLQWYGVNGDRNTVKTALQSNGLGFETTDLTNVQKGDFVQIWRRSGSGHTAIFIGWVYNAMDEIIGFNYWSSNGGTGVGYRTEYFGPGEKDMLWEETFFMKVIAPEKK